MRGIKRKYELGKKLRGKWPRRVLLALSIALLVAGAYVLFLTLSPNANFIPTEIDLNTADDATDQRNRIQIERINLEVPYNAGGQEALNEGAWWRRSDRGNPKDGGNFILSAHRFYIGLTPQGTRAKSPFYRLEELDSGSTIRVFYEGQWYDYVVTKKYTVKPTAVEIEARSDEPKMTLYTCTLGGSDDGRVVIEARPLTTSQ